MRTDPDDTRYFYPNLANTYIFNKPVAINSKADIRKKVISEIRSMELADKLNYPSSGYKLKAITAFKIFIYHHEHVLGDSDAVIPKVIRENKHVINFPKTNNKCVFHCIAWHTLQSAKKDPRKIQAQVKAAFKRYCLFKGLKYTLSLFRSFKPIELLQLDEVEDCFQLGINVYSTDVASGNVECIRRSDKGLKNHKKNQCELVNIESFPAEPTIYKPTPNAIRSLLTKYSIKEANQYIAHFVVYDFEAILKPTATQHGENTVFGNEHIPVSVSVADSLTEEVRCFVNDDPKMLLTDMFKCSGDVSVEIQQYNVDKYKSLLQEIINAHGLTGMEIPGVNLGKKYKMSDVESWIKEGNELFAIIGTDNIKSVIKNPSYMCIAASNIKMLDISNYVPAGTSYDKYLTTYLGGCKCDDKIRCVCGLGEGLFPNEYISSFDVLSQTTIPPKLAFDSKLRGTSITSDDYERLKFVWGYCGMKSIKDLLVWYNNLDVSRLLKPSASYSCVSNWICSRMECRYLDFRRRLCINSSICNLCFNHFKIVWCLVEGMTIL
ncbi:unnamed protein product [Phytophthora lilii]|uniref:Unnamed protein product n=1 Tax=Phytophthora lilii TaxID=2077276 RepID=A0A9W6TWY9_9STRA|nr:unnamed protein product [Phytophthora lilii]